MARWFKDSEIVGLSPHLVERLDNARSIAGIPFIITSGKRNPSDNLAAGGVQDSSHLKGLAVDLVCASGVHRFSMVSALLAAGFFRIGIYDAHIHADIDPSLPQNVIWTGKSH